MKGDQVNLQAYRRQKNVRLYLDNALQVPEARILLDLYPRIKGARVLDLGCGAGRMAFYLGTMAGDYLGFDYSEEMIEQCRRRFPDLAFEVRDMRQLTDLADGSFDVILIAFNAMDYIDHAGRIEVLTHVRRLLKDDGRLIFSAHNRHAWDRRKWHCPVPLKTKHPCFFLSSALRALTYWPAYLRLRPLQEITAEYAIVNDGAHSFEGLTYYIDRVAQEKQLAALNMKILQAYDLAGNEIAPGQDDADNDWIYYVAAKS